MDAPYALGLLVVIAVVAHVVIAAAVTHGVRRAARSATAEVLAVLEERGLLRDRQDA